MGLNPPPDDPFYRQILRLEERLSLLQKAPPLDQGHVVEVALEELKVSLEELHVAHEEMQQQNRELEEARCFLEDERQRYRELFNLAPDGYLVTDHHGVISEANQMLASQLGQPADLLVGKPLVLLVAEEYRRDFGRQLHRLGQHGQAGEFEARLQPRARCHSTALFTWVSPPGPLRCATASPMGMKPIPWSTLLPF